MSKEKTLAKFNEKIRQAVYNQEVKPVIRSIFTNSIQEILFEAINQTREETIMAIPEEMIFNEETDSEESKTWIAGFNNCRNQILNKLKN